MTVLDASGYPVQVPVCTGFRSAFWDDAPFLPFLGARTSLDVFFSALHHAGPFGCATYATKRCRCRASQVAQVGMQAGYGAPPPGYGQPQYGQAPPMVVDQYGRPVQVVQQQAYPTGSAIPKKKGFQLGDVDF